MCGLSWSVLPIGMAAIWWVGPTGDKGIHTPRMASSVALLRIPVLRTFPACT